jgi:hypothetical protein
MPLHLRRGKRDGCKGVGLDGQTGAEARIVNEVKIVSKLGGGDIACDGSGRCLGIRWKSRIYERETPIAPTYD